jgi:hypothetical protein
MQLAERLGRWLDRSGGRDTKSGQQQLGQLLASLVVMAWFVEARDPYTGGHLWRVSLYAKLLAEAGGLDRAEAARVSLGGFLHDLGKIGVPDAILRKADRLTDDEYAVIKTHPETGMRMLAGHPLAALVRDAVQLHHERPDGRGYPLGLRGEDIPPPARIVGICDAFDAMTSHRPYRAGMTIERGLAILGEFAGRQFDRVWTARFIELGHAGALTHVQGHSDEGIPLQACPMCGPTLVVRREQQPGEYLYCRQCGGEFVLAQSDAGPRATPTGRKGEPKDLEPVADHALIARAVNAAVEAMPVAALVRDVSLLDSAHG